MKCIADRVFGKSDNNCIPSAVGTDVFGESSGGLPVFGRPSDRGNSVNGAGNWTDEY
jgi:hypothetical protein